jgi:hypothetical protein
MNTEETRYQRAKDRVQAMKSFYVHLTVYIAVNLLLIFINMTVSPEALWFIWPLAGWGIAIVIQAFSVFGPGLGFGANWEERKIRELMDKE